MKPRSDYFLVVVRDMPNALERRRLIYGALQEALRADVTVIDVEAGEIFRGTSKFGAFC